MYRPALVTKSDGAAVRISNGSRPAARSSTLSAAAISSRCEKHAARSDDVFTIATLGRSHISGGMPRAV